MFKSIIGPCFLLGVYLGLISTTTAAPLQLKEIEVVPIQQTGTGKRYDLYIKVPEDYAKDTNKRYPVIYYTDALWHVELLSSAMSYMLENSILVGISWQTNNDPALVNEVGQHVSRYRDYNYVESSNPETQAKYQMGKAKQHLQFIRNDVFSYVEEHYRTQPDTRTYFGYSLGGEFGLYTLLTEPNVFRNYIVGSPSVRDSKELEEAASSEVKQLNANLFITHGSLEDKLGKGVKSVIRYLSSRNDPTLAVTHEVIEGTHQSAFPMTGIKGIEWLGNTLNAGDEE